MYHEAKKYEKKVKEILVDYRKRAERRQSFYQKIKTDPTQLLQIHGRKCKIHIDSSSGMQDVGTMMKWNNEVMIDRFDGRAHLDFIPQITIKTEKDSDQEVSMEERQLNYERFRILILNEFLCFKEQDFLAQLDELYEINAQNDLRSKKKKQSNKAGISIGYTYDTEEYPPQTFSQNIATVESKLSNSRYDELAKDSSDSDMDFDLPIDINKVSTSDANELNATARRYGMLSNDFFSFITNDIDELQALKEAQKEESGKVNRTGRRERRERREKKMRPISSSIPSYAKTESDQVVQIKQEDESSESNTEVPEKITYITSFGSEEPKTEKNTRSQKPLYSEKLKENLDKFKSSNKRRKYSRRYSTSSSSSSSSKSSDRRTKQHVNIKDSPKSNQTVEVPIKRYYGRNRNSSDSSQLSCDSSSNYQEESLKSTDNSQNNAQSRGGKSSTSAKGLCESTGEPKINQKERLKRKMQILLNKQYKEDKKLETQKKLQQIEEQKEREVEMKELALKLRKRQRELRHQYSSSEHEEPQQSRSRENSKTKQRKRSRSKSSSSSSTSSKSSKSSYDRRRSDRSRYRRNDSPETSNHYSNKYERHDGYRNNYRDRRSPDRYRRDRSRYRSRSFDRPSSRKRF